MKVKGTRLGDNFRITEDRKIARDEKKIESKLDLCTKLKRRASKKIRAVRRADKFMI